MPLSQSELLDLVDEVSVAVAHAIASYAELTEGMVDDAAKSKVDRLKAKTDDAKKRLTNLRDRERHKRAVERRRKENERSASRAIATEGKTTGVSLASSSMLRTALCLSHSRLI